jgi:peptidoglycan/xylan/chitin deacetylase (PgdA/CDA1 family)
MKNGKFVISLDFELFWGVRDKRTIENYGANILGVQQAIPAMLELFDRYGIKATFSTVGFLFAKNKEELIAYCPAVKPVYNDTNLSPYPEIPAIGNDEKDDPWHFGYSLLNRIRNNGKHEIGTHTFSHYYCLEPGQTAETFRQDILAAKKIAGDMGINVRSLVFPRNQFNEEYLAVCHETGIDSFRGNPSSWLYAGRNKNDESLFRRMLRFADTYLNFSGHHCHSKEEMLASQIINIPASRFLRPYSRKLSFLDGLRLRRIKQGMRHAAKTGQLFHLWWHPHNFGANLKENIAFLEKIVQYYHSLNKQYDFSSITMSGLCDELKEKADG